MDASGRRDLLLKLADLIERDHEYFEELESMDNGKPLGRKGQYGTVGDVALAVSHFRYFAGWADKIHVISLEDMYQRYESGALDQQVK